MCASNYPSECAGRCGIIAHSTYAVFTSRARAMTLIDVLVVVSLLLMGILLVWPFVGGRSRGPSRRTWCAANLKGIGTGLYTYGSENRDMFPIAPHKSATESGFTAVEYAPGAMGLHGERESDEMDKLVSTTRNFWMLVRDGASAPGSFICPSTDDVKADIDDPLLCWDFGTTTTDCTGGPKEALKQVSYGYQVPYGQVGQPSADRDQRMALAADRGPYSVALETGATHPGTPRLDTNATPEDWIPWNSPNHSDGEGQNVLYADSHVEIQTKPTVGVDDDNIYTRWRRPDAELKGRLNGTPPTGDEAPYSETDSLIYP